MSLAITDEQRALESGLLAFAATLDARGELDWEHLVVGFGLDGLGRSEADGGLGSDPRDAAIVANVLGQSGAELPWAEHWVATRLGASEDDAWRQDALALLHAAEMVGLCRAMLSDAIGFARQREQFGVAIATFQVLRHRMVDMRLALEQADALVGYAVDLLDGDAALRARAVSAARVMAEDAVRIVGEGAVQVHGAMGLTAELRVGRFFRYARRLAQADGTARQHLRRYALAA